MKSLRLLISGGSGYLASALRKHLAESSEVEWVTITRNISERNFSDRETIIHGDPWSVQTLPSHIDVTIHLAGLVGDATCHEQPELAERLNVEGTKRIHELSRRFGAERFIFVSSASIYDDGSHDTVLKDERSPANPKATYGQTKLKAERYLQQAVSGPAIYILRFPAIVGVSPVMKVDTFANKFYTDAVRTGQISILTESNFEICRPIVTMEHALQALTSVATSTISPGVYNVISENQPVRIYAERIQKELSRRGIAVEIIPQKISNPSSYRVESHQQSIISKDPSESFIRAINSLWERDQLNVK